ncbi:unnamed protein product [Ectocarpus sp. 13 AM-2016]
MDNLRDRERAMDNSFVEICLRHCVCVCTPVFASYERGRRWGWQWREANDATFRPHLC